MREPKKRTITLAERDDYEDQSDGLGVPRGIMSAFGIYAIVIVIGAITYLIWQYFQ